MGEGEEEIGLNGWDFGGQDIYYGTNRMFHHGRAVFVLLWEEDMEAESEDGYGNRSENFSLSYWLEYIRSVEPEACVVAVNNSARRGKSDRLSLRSYLCREKEEGALGRLRVFDWGATEVGGGRSDCRTGGGGGGGSSAGGEFAVGE